MDRCQGGKRKVHQSQCHNVKTMNTDDHCYFWETGLLFSNRFSKKWKTTVIDFLVAHTVWTNCIADKRNILSIPCSRPAETKDQSIIGFDKDKYWLKQPKSFGLRLCCFFVTISKPPLWSKLKYNYDYFWMNYMKLHTDMPAPQRMDPYDFLDIWSFL